MPTLISGPGGTLYRVVRLKKGEKESKALKDFAGTISTGVMPPAWHIITADKINKAEGQTFKGKDGGVLLALRRDSATNDYPYVDDAGTRFVASDDVMKTRANSDSTSYDVWGIGRVSVSPRAEVLVLSNVFAREQGVTGLSSDPARAARLRTTRVLGGISSRIACSGDAGAGCVVG